MGVRVLPRASIIWSVGVSGGFALLRSELDGELLSNLRNASPKRPFTMFLVLLVREERLERLLCFDWLLLRRLFFCEPSCSMARRNPTLEGMFFSSVSESESISAADGGPFESDGASKFRPGAPSRSRRKSRLDSTWMLVGLPCDCADFDLSSEVPMSRADGRWLSSEGRDDAGDFGIASVDVCDLDRAESSSDGRVGRVKSGLRVDGLGCGFSNVFGWLRVRL